MNREKIRKFSARARDFIVAYNILEQKGVGNSTSSLNVLSLTKVDIERTRKSIDLIGVLSVWTLRGVRQILWLNRKERTM